MCNTITNKTKATFRSCSQAPSLAKGRWARRYDEVGRVGRVLSSELRVQSLARSLPELSRSVIQNSDFRIQNLTHRLLLFVAVTLPTLFGGYGVGFAQEAVLNAPTGQTGYQWYEAGSTGAVPIAGATASSLNVFLPGVYYATFDNNNCSMMSDYTVLTSPAGLDNTIILDATVQPGASYEWFAVSPPGTGTPTSVGTGVQLTLTATTTPTEYYVEITKANGYKVITDSFTVVQSIDTDGDEVPDSVELLEGTNSTLPNGADDFFDADEDGVPDYVENLENTDPNPGGEGDFADSDADGVPDYVERQDGTDPADPTNYTDTDGDGVPDYVEERDGTDPELASSYADGDAGGIPDYVEDTLLPNSGLPATNIADIEDDFSVDTDGDGFPDAVEVLAGTDPNLDTSVPADTDGDGVPDIVEVLQNTDPAVATSYRDSDGDLVPDYVEWLDFPNSDPFDPDAFEDNDGDRVPDYIEDVDGTSTADAEDYLDTDSDGVPDYQENKDGTDPSDATDYTDTDGGLIPDYIEEVLLANVGGAATDSAVFADDMSTDTDGDGAPDSVEALAGTALDDAAETPVDTDGDGVPDVIEVLQGTDPAVATSVLDTDGDLVPDYIELIAIPQTDVNDPAEYTDTDGDGVPDFVEENDGTDPEDATDYVDTDGGDIADYIEETLLANLGLPTTDPLNQKDDYSNDTDEDGHPDVAEVLAGSDPNDADEVPLDTDGDGVPDAIEAIEGTDPNDSTDYLDTDDDGVPNYVENQNRTDPLDATDFPDTDGDGVPDYVEVLEGSNPDNANSFLDTDGDGVPDYTEIATGTDPNAPCDPVQEIGYNGFNGDNPVWAAADCDGDTLLNGDELSDGTDPYNPDTDGDGTPDNLDAFPNDPSEDTDADGDGVGANADFDDNDPEVGSQRPSLNISTTFTPNGDSVNEVWTIQRIDKFPTATIEVFNRYGHKIHSMRATDPAWNGRYNNSAARVPSGSYYYVINFNDGSGFQRRGWIYVNY